MIKGLSRGYQPIEHCGVIGELFTIALVTDGAGAKGLRWYEWRWLLLAQPMHPAWRRWLWVRRSVSAPTDLTASVVFAPHESSLEVVRVAGSCWAVESCFEAAKGEVGQEQ
jgi:hypothetical protein